MSVSKTFIATWTHHVSLLTRSNRKDPGQNVSINGSGPPDPDTDPDPDPSTGYCFRNCFRIILSGRHGNQLVSWHWFTCIGHLFVVTGWESHRFGYLNVYFNAKDETHVYHNRTTGNPPALLCAYYGRMANQRPVHVDSPSHRLAYPYRVCHGDPHMG